MNVTAGQKRMFVRSIVGFALASTIACSRGDRGAASADLPSTTSSSGECKAVSKAVPAYAAVNRGAGFRVGPVVLIAPSLTIRHAPNGNGVYAEKVLLYVDATIGTPVRLSGHNAISGASVGFSHDTGGAVTSDVLRRGSVSFSWAPLDVTTQPAMPGSFGFPSPGCYEVTVSVGTVDYGPFGFNVKQAW